MMQLFTKWELITRTLRYVLGSRNDDLLTIGGHVLAVPSIEHHLVDGLTLISGLLMIVWVCLVINSHYILVISLFI